MVSKQVAALVTDHAIVRWLERVEHYDFDEVRQHFIVQGREPTDTRILDYLGNKFGLFRGHVIYRIVTKKVRIAMQAGATRIKRDTNTLVVADGRVVSIITGKNPRRAKAILRKFPPSSNGRTADFESAN